MNLPFAGRHRVGAGPVRRFVLGLLAGSLAAAVVIVVPTSAEAADSPFAPATPLFDRVADTI